jgi:hypothetical protein
MAQDRLGRRGALGRIERGVVNLVRLFMSRRGGVWAAVAYLLALHVLVVATLPPSARSCARPRLTLPPPPTSPLMFGVQE